MTKGIGIGSLAIVECILGGDLFDPQGEGLRASEGISYSKILTWLPTLVV